MMPGYEYSTVKEVNSPLQMALHLPMTFPRYHGLLLSLGPDSPAVVVEARCDERLVGVGLAVLKETHAEAEVLSIFVNEQHRGQGIGSQLLAHLEQELIARSAASAKLSYQTGQLTTAPLERILHKQQWSEPETALIVCMATAESIKNAPWLRNQTLPDGFSEFKWTSLSETEREAVRKKQQEENWYPEQVSPFLDEHLIEPVSSIGIRHNASGEIAGWMVTHLITPKMLRYTSRFVSPPYRYYNLGSYLIVQSIKLGFDQGVAEIGMWHFPPDNLTTVRFTERTIKPYLTAYNQIKHTHKTFAAEPLK